MVALDKNTGDIVWKAPSTNELAGYASPLLFEYGGLRIIATLTLKGFIGVNADNGALLWHIKHESYADENVLLPIHQDGEIFISTLKAGSIKWKINIDGDEVTLEELWRTDQMDNHHGGVLLVDGYLYGASTFKNSEKWICLDWKTGEVKFADKGIGKGSLTYADGMLYMLSKDRAVGLVRPNPEKYDLVSSFMIPRGGKHLSWAHPVVCDGRLYIRHGEFLYAYHIR